MNTYEETVKAYRERYDYIIETYVCDGFTEITGSIGGDVERVRIYKDGSIGVK